MQENPGITLSSKNTLAIEPCSAYNTGVIVSPLCFKQDCLSPVLIEASRLSIKNDILGITPIETVLASGWATSLLLYKKKARRKQIAYVKRKRYYRKGAAGLQ